MFVTQQFNFKYKKNNVAKVEKTDNKRFVVKEIHDNNIIILGEKLYQDRLLMYSTLTKNHEFLPIENEAYDLYTTDQIKLAQIVAPAKKSTDASIKYQWIVKKVYSSEHEGMIVSRSKLSLGATLTWSQQPRQYYWLPCSAAQKLADLRNIHKKAYEKDQNIAANYGQLDITYLPLYEWLKDDIEGRPKQIPYGRFRQHLLDAAKDNMKKLHKQGKYVYMMPFDPDCKSLLIKGKTNLFDMYTDNIHRYHYPSIMTSGFTFTDHYIHLNRVFQLNRELQVIFQTILPGSAYYSECNSIILYNPNFIEDKYFKFGLYGSEILPIIKYIASSNLSMVILKDAPLVTTVPFRMLNVMPVTEQRKTMSKRHYKKILQLSQILISTHNFMSALISGLSIHVNTNSKLRTYLCELWKLHCPLLIMEQRESTPSSDYISQLRFICQKYSAFYSIDNEKYVKDLNHIRHQCIITMPNPKKQTNSTKKQTRDNLIDKCIEISRKCGQLCALHILKWMDIHENNI